MGCVYSGVWERRNAYRIFVGNTLGKQSLGKSSGRWKDHIIIALWE
jgi:hypothetical protein